MFDDNMLNELSKLKANRKRKRVEDDFQEDTSSLTNHGDILPEDDSDFEEIVYETEENYDDIPVEQDNEFIEEEAENQPQVKSLSSTHDNLSNLADFMTGVKSNKALDPAKHIKETYTENDFSTDENEARDIKNQSKKAVDYKDVDGNQVKSRYIDETGQINVVYGQPGKNIVNRKSVEEQRLDVKFGALADLLTKFKSADEIHSEENDPDVIIMDKEVNLKKDLKKFNDFIEIKSDLQIKISLVNQAFKNISDSIEKKSKLPQININITNPDYLRAMFLNRSFDDMDVARIFTLSLFLQTPEKFPTEDTYEQVQYLNSQVGAKCKSIDLKRMITYISSDNEFNQTVDLVTNILKSPNFNTSGVHEVFNVKCKEAIKALMIKYLRNDSLDIMSRVNVLSIKKDSQMKHRSLDSSISLLDTLAIKLKSLHPSLKDQRKKTEEQINNTKEKIEGLKNDIINMETELTLLLTLDIARKKGGYNLAFIDNIPKEEIYKQLKEYEININSENVKKVLENCITDEMLNNVLRTR